ncbi:MAG: hypothetical protein LIO41_07490 [Ruminococcus sp.]|nr:hypothetical protein [Ruminococcus sp.]MCD7805165.1 hypothetical protein [Oscillospiraceae bacterium]
MKICQVCGKPIDVTSRAKKYCSPECRAKVKYERDRAWLAAHPEKAAEYSRKYYAANSDYCKAVSKEAYRRKCLEQYKKSES